MVMMCYSLHHQEAVMEAEQFDARTTRLFAQLSRRRSIGMLGMLGFGSLMADDVAGKKKKKKSTLCLNGANMTTSSKKKRKKLIKHGATVGACVAPGSCNCASNELCHEGVCRPCTVTCTGDAIACGSALQQRLLDGGTIYACPGRYEGGFTMGTARLIGAGSGDNPATSTILDAAEKGRTLELSANALAELLSIRITGGKSINGGGGIRAAAGGDLRLTNCAVVNNEVANGTGGGILAGVPVRLTNSLVSGNSAGYGGGLHLTGTTSSFITDSEISANHSLSSNGFGGGGILNEQTSLTIVGTEISGNTSKYGGAGIEVFAGAIALNAACRVVNNTMSVGPGAGGIYVTAPATATVNGATVSGNSTPQCVGAAC
jgi:hypothetical protein